MPDRGNKWKAPFFDDPPFPAKQIILYVPRNDEAEAIIRGMFVELFDAGNFWDDVGGAWCELAAEYFQDFLGQTLESWDDVS